MKDFENEHIPEVLPILPLRNTVLFPQQVIPISIGREKSVSLISKVSETNKLIGVVAQRDLTLAPERLPRQMDTTAHPCQGIRLLTHSTAIKLRL